MLILEMLSFPTVQEDLPSVLVSVGGSTCVERGRIRGDTGGEGEEEGGVGKHQDWGVCFRGIGPLFHSAGTGGGQG